MFKTSEVTWHPTVFESTAPKIAIKRLGGSADELALLKANEISGFFKINWPETTAFYMI